MLKLRIREVAEAKGINQTQLARLAWVDIKSVARYWKQKNTQVDLLVLDRIAKALDVPAISLFVEISDEKGRPHEMEQ